jgi:single-strand DNA-binding protein
MPMPRATTQTATENGPPDDPGDEDHANQVRLRGRVSAAPENRVLPSGDRLVSARLVVARPPGPARLRQSVDVLDCVAWTARARRLVTGWQPGSVVEVEGAIRRRFRRGPAGLTSRVEIEVVSARRVRPAPVASPQRASPRSASATSPASPASSGEPPRLSAVSPARSRRRA